MAGEEIPEADASWLGFPCPDCGAPNTRCTFTDDEGEEWEVIACSACESLMELNPQFGSRDAGNATREGG